LNTCDLDKIKQILPDISEDCLAVNGVSKKPILKRTVKATEAIKPVTGGKLPLAIKMPYIGACLSVNHYKYGHYTRPEVKRWMNDLGWAVIQYNIDWAKTKLPLHVTCSGTFKDNRYPDLSNLSKVIMDGIKKVTHIDDKYYRWHDGTVTIGGYPELIIEIREEIAHQTKDRSARTIC